MSSLIDVQQRRVLPERMDDPGLDGRLHRRALAGLTRINLISRTAAMLWRPIYGLARENPGPPLRLLDLATGAGDVPMRLLRLAQRAGVSLSIDACDLSERALDFARARAAPLSAKIRFFQLNAVKQEIPDGYDIVTCSTFLHHLARTDAVTLLTGMRRAAERLVLVNDLRRCSPGLLAAYVGTHLLTRCPVVHVDGPRSVRAAYTIEELRSMALEAGMKRTRISRRWPWRMLLKWHA